MDAELRVLVTKDDKEIRRASNKRPAVGFEQDMSTAEKMTKVPKQIRLEENKRPEHVLLDVDSLTDNRLNVLKKTKLEKTIESLSQETNISTNAANRSKRTLNTELRVCLHRLPIREGRFYYKLYVCTCILFYILGYSIQCYEIFCMLVNKP